MILYGIITSTSPYEYFFLFTSSYFLLVSLTSANPHPLKILPQHLSVPPFQIPIVQINTSVKADVIIRMGYHLLLVCIWWFGEPKVLFLLDGHINTVSHFQFFNRYLAQIRSCAKKFTWNLQFIFALCFEVQYMSSELHLNTHTCNFCSTNITEKKFIKHSDIAKQIQ